MGERERKSALRRSVSASAFSASVGAVSKTLVEKSEELLASPALTHFRILRLGVSFSPRNSSTKRFQKACRFHKRIREGRLYVGFPQHSKIVHSREPTYTKVSTRSPKPNVCFSREHTLEVLRAAKSPSGASVHTCKESVSRAFPKRTQNALSVSESAVFLQTKAPPPPSGRRPRREQRLQGQTPGSRKGCVSPTRTL